MAYNVAVYKGCNRLGTGSMTNGSKSLSSYTGTAPGTGRNVLITNTSGNHVGHTIKTRIVTDGGSTLTLQDAGPHS